MTSHAPAPLVPPNCDLQDFAFMPLDVARLRDSELATSETPEACWAALLLWCASWHQVPAASLPNDEKWIADKAGYVARGKIDKAWAEVRAGAMRGWILCSDGRYYHPVVAEKARDAWMSKLKQRWMTECARVKKANQRNGTNHTVPDFEEWVSMLSPQGQGANVPRDTAGLSPGTPPPCPKSVPRETASKGQGEGQGQRERINTPPAPPAHAHEGSCEVFPIAEGWQPSEAFSVQAKLLGLPVLDTASMAAGLAEFVAFWMARPREQRTQAEWENALAKSLKREAVRNASAPTRPAAGTRPGRAPSPAEIRLYRSSPHLMDPDARARVEAHLGQQPKHIDVIDMEAPHGTAIGMD